MAEQNNQPAQEMTQQELSEQIKIRREKLAQLQAEGKDPFEITKCEVTHHSDEIKDNFEELEEKDVAIAGRLMSKRIMGKASFCNIQDRNGNIQSYVSRNDIGDEAYAAFKKFDIGDLISIKGFVFKTKTGEVSVHAKEVTLLSKSLQVLPEKFHGLKDQELRYRQRYLDLIVNPEVRDTFIKRSRIITEIRKFLDGKGFLEVETPVLQTIPGGASARPFITHHNTLDIDMYCRIALELPLKRLIVGGFERVYEIGRVFRNEGISVRHNPEFTTGDFSMFRIYADANGEPAEYSESNVPLKTPKFLPISIKGLNEGDYAMIMGFPGSTERYLTQSEVKQRMNAVNQAMIDMRGVRLEVLRKYMDASDKTRIQYASKFAGSSNYWKNSIGMNKAIIDNDVLGAKAEIEKKYATFAQGKPEYEGVVEKIDAIIEKSTPTLRQLYYTNEALRGAIEFGSTYLIMDNIKKALEEKNDSLLQASKKQLKNAYDGIHNKDYDHEVDRAVAKAILPALAKALNADELPSFYQTINGEFKGDYNAYVDNIYDNSILSNRKNLDKFLAKPTVKAIEKDPATAYSRSKNEKLQELGKQYMELESGMELLHKAYIRGLGEMKQPVPSYPDANFTMRLTYGNVKSYSPRDAVHYDYYTTTDGILEKENPEDREFVVPAKLKELIQKKDFGRYAMADGTMPVCFLTTNDITGGNSGSPVINGEGQLIGTAFDGNWESLSGDINFNNDLQRCIALDIRYVLFILDKLGNCSHLIKEMNIIE